MTQLNPALEELSSFSQCASQQVCEFLLENLVKDRLCPTVDDSNRFVTAMAFTIAYLELYLKLHLPEDQQAQTRQILEQFSAGMASHVKILTKKIQSDLTTSQESGILYPDKGNVQEKGEQNA